jgi:hypothetical protein
MPAQKNAAGIAACRGEPEDNLYLFSNVCQPPSRYYCSVLSSGRRCAWTHMTPIGVDIESHKSSCGKGEPWVVAFEVSKHLHWVGAARSPIYVLSLLPVVRGKATVVGKAFEVRSFCLPVEGYDQKFPVNCLRC